MDYKSTCSCCGQSIKAKEPDPGPKYTNYPKDHSPDRPFYVEIKTEGETREIRLFKAQYLYFSSEVHPLNLGLNGFLGQHGRSFWSSDFIEFFIDAINDKYQKTKGSKFLVDKTLFLAA